MSDPILKLFKNLIQNPNIYQELLDGMGLTGSGQGAKTVSLNCGDVASANTDYENVDAEDEADGGEAIVSPIIITNGNFAIAEVNQPVVPRNFCIELSNGVMGLGESGPHGMEGPGEDPGNDSGKGGGGAKNLYEGVMTFKLSGLDYMGRAQEEDISFTSTVGNKGIADGEGRYKYGVKAFSALHNVTMDHAPDDGIRIAVGQGSKISLLGALANGVEEDVVQATMGGVIVDKSGVVDVENNTFNFNDIAEDTTISIVYFG